MASARVLRTAASPDALDALHALLDELWAAEPEVSGADRAAFVTALAEVAANVVEHAAPGAAGCVLRVQVRVTPDELVAEVDDDGGPYTPGEPRPAPGPEDESGRGLALAHVLLDELGYERRGTVNLWSLRRRRTP